jgi:hypothetical protein
VTEETTIQPIKELDLRGAVLLEKAKEETLNKAREVISSTSFIEIDSG